MATCDWCDLEVAVDESVPVELRRHTGIDGEPSDKELTEDGPLPRDPRLIGECCPFCFGRGFHRQPPQFWMKDERKRAERATRDLGRILDG